jgi:hypothetical protein
MLSDDLTHDKSAQRTSALAPIRPPPYETMDLFRIAHASATRHAHIADNAILLQHVHDGPLMNRSPSVLQARGSKNSFAISEFRCPPTASHSAPHSTYVRFPAEVQ